MTLIAINPVTEPYNPSSINLSIIAELKPTAGPQDVVSELALECLAEIQKFSLGTAQSLKKVLATSLTYTSLLALPIGALGGALWHVSNEIKEMTSLSQAQRYLVAGTSLSAFWLADVAIGKLSGIRPFTAISIAAYDAYRQFALTVSKQVRESYAKQEQKLKEESDSNREIALEQLNTIYKEIASELGRRHKDGTLTTEIQTLEMKLPLVKQLLSQTGLKKVEISSILSPLQDMIKLLKPIDKK